MSGGPLTFEEPIVLGRLRSEDVSQHLPVLFFLLSSFPLAVAVLSKNASGTTQDKKKLYLRGAVPS